MKRKTPAEYYENCITSEKQELANLLIEDRFLTQNANHRSLNLNDQIFIDNLNILKDKRHLLSIEEELYINSLAMKFRYL